MFAKGAGQKNCEVKKDMKRLNVKKLAAVGAGAALMSSALALPVVAQYTPTLDDLIGNDGKPNVTVVVGEKAAVSDVLWAGKIAAKIAQLAPLKNKKKVQVTARLSDDFQLPTNGGGGETVKPEASAQVTNITATLQVGGTQKVVAGAKIYDDQDLNSMKETELGTKTLTHSQLDFLIDETKDYWIQGNSDSQRVQEKIIVSPDAKFETDKRVKDLVMYFDSRGDVKYKVELGDGIPTSWRYTTGSDRNSMQIPFFGEWYGVLYASATELRLAKNLGEPLSYSTGETITGLKGAGKYAGQELTLEIGTYSSNTNTIGVILKDASGNEITSKDVKPGTFLEEEFADNDGNPYFSDSVYVDSIYQIGTEGKGKVSVYVGKDIVKIKHNEVYPYDPTASSSEKYWLAKFTVTNNKIMSIEIYNNIRDMSRWDYRNPIFPSEEGSYLGALTEDGKNGLHSMVFLNGAPEDTVGYGFFEVEFNGWKSGDETTTWWLTDDIAADTTGAGAGVLKYTDDSDNYHEVPFFYPELSGDTITRQVIELGGTNYYFGMEMPTGGIQNPCDGNTYDGYFNISTTDEPASMADYIAGVNPADVNTTGLESGYYCDTDKNFYFKKIAPADIITKTKNMKMANVLLEGTDRNFYYAFVNPGTEVWLLLDDSTVFAPKYGGLDFKGTDVNEDKTIDVLYYLPNTTDLGGGQSDVFYVAWFSFTDGAPVGGKVYMDTADATLIDPENTDLTTYNYEMEYTGVNGETLQLTEENAADKVQEAYSDYGSYFSILNEEFKAVIPEKKRKIKYTVKGKSVTTEVTGGETVTLAEGETKTVAGTTFTLQKVDYNLSVSVTPETCPATSAAAISKADIEKYIETTVDPTEAYMPVNFSVDSILTTDTTTVEISGPKILVGGWLVNTMVDKDTKLDDGTTLGDKVSEKGYVVEKVSSGDIYIVGYTAQDTAQAASEFVSALDKLFA